jgi:mRNA-degrading endonuclease RelE of RelBE toxin-antitoxin system
MAYSELVKRTPVSVVETGTFVRQVDALLSTSSREELIGFLAFNPEAGDVIPGTGGIRKVRWAVLGKGKRGGLRVIYYFHSELMPLFLLTAYAKGKKTDLSRAEQRALEKIAKAVRAEYLERRRR